MKAGGWKIERGWYTEGSSVRIIFIEKEEKEEEKVEKEKTLPYSTSPGKRKIGDRRCEARKKMTDKGARGSCGRSFVDWGI